MPLLWVSLSFLAGVLLAPILGGEPYVWLSLSGGCWLLYWLRRRKTSHHLPNFPTSPLLQISPLILCLAFFLGGFRYHVTRPVLDDHTLAAYNDAGRIQLSGKIVRPPDPLDQAILLDVAVDEIIQLNDVSIHLPVQGRCLVRAVPGTKYRYGDRVVFSGHIKTPPHNEDFSYRDYLAIKGIYSYMMYPLLDQLTPSDRISGYAFLFAFRERAFETINDLLPQPEAGLLSGILIGMERDIPEDVQEAFQKTGTSHIVAISGFNIALVSGLLTLFLDRILGKRWAPIGVIGGIGLYTILVGAQAAVVRAAIMGSICLVGRQIGRGSSGSTTLLFTAALMTWQNPLILGDVGFQLSFSATLGLVLFAGPWQDSLTRWIEKTFSEALAARLSGPISEFFLFTLAAQLTTLPIILVHFGRFSWSAFLANPLILPAQPWIMMLGGPVILAGMLIPPLGQVLIWLVWPLLYYTIHMVGWIAKIPAGALSVELYYSLGVVLLLLLICITLLLRKKSPKLAVYMRPGMLIFVLILANSFLWREAVRSPNGRLAVIFYPQPDCSVLSVESPNGARVLINTGSQVSSISADLGENLPILDRSLDLLIVPQDKTACFSAMPRLMERIAIQRVLFPPQMPSSRVLSQIDEFSLSNGIQSVPSNTDLQINLGEDTLLWVYPSQNGLALTQVLVWQDFRALFLWDGNLPCSKIEQHASYFNLYFDGRKEPFSLQQECPHLSAGLQVVKKPLNRSGSMEVNLEAYKKLTISSDGEQIWINGFRP